MADFEKLGVEMGWKVWYKIGEITEDFSWEDFEILYPIIMRTINEIFEGSRTE